MGDLHIYSLTTKLGSFDHQLDYLSDNEMADKHTSAQISSRSRHMSDTFHKVITLLSFGFK